MNFTTFCNGSDIFWKQNNAQGLFTLGSFWPKAADCWGPWPICRQATLARSWQLGHGEHLPGTKGGRRFGARGKRGRGPGGPEPHQEVAGVFGSAEDGPAAATNICRGNGDGGGDSEHGSSIPWPGRRSTGWRTFSAHRRSSGQCLAAAGGDGHGGKLG
jgi:hypothetical protein